MRKSFPFLIFYAYAMVQPANAEQALPRALVTLSSPIVRVADLFSNPGAEAQVVLGNAPPPGSRIVIGASQLAAIAAAYQVPWQPDGSAAQVVLAAPGTAIPAATISDALASAVATAGGPKDAAISLPDFSAPLIPPGTTPAITITRMDYDPGTHNFSASMVISAAGMAPQSLDLTGLAEASQMAVVAAHDLTPGEVLSASDITLAKLPAGQAAGTVTIANAMGLAVNRGVPAGGAVVASNLSTPIIVRKGGLLMVHLDVPGMTLTAEGIALGSGGEGSVISVLNPASHAVVQAVITGPGSASIAPGSTPLSGPQSLTGYGGYGSYAQVHGAAMQVMQP